MFAVVVSPASLTPSSSRSPHASTTFVLASELLNVNANWPDALVVPDAVDGSGDPPPVTVKVSGMNCSTSPLAPLTVAVNVADCPQGLVAGPLISTVEGGEKSTRAEYASVEPPVPARPSPHTGWTTLSEPTKLPL